MKKSKLRKIIREVIKEKLQEERSFPVTRKCVRDYNVTIIYTTGSDPCSNETCGKDSTCPTGCKCGGKVANIRRGDDMEPEDFEIGE